MKMSLKAVLAKPFANYIYKQTKKAAANAVADQEAIMLQLLKSAAKTEFGIEHQFSQINTYNDFKANIPLRDYEALKPYI